MRTKRTESGVRVQLAYGLTWDTIQRRNLLLEKLRKANLAMKIGNLPDDGQIKPCSKRSS